MKSFQKSERDLLYLTNPRTPVLHKDPMVALFFVQRQLSAATKPSAAIPGIEEAPAIISKEQRAPKGVEAVAKMRIKIVPTVSMLPGKDDPDGVFFYDPGAGDKFVRPNPEGRMRRPSLDLLSFLSRESGPVRHATRQELKTVTGGDAVFQYKLVRRPSFRTNGRGHKVSHCRIITGIPMAVRQSTLSRSTRNSKDGCQ